MPVLLLCQGEKPARDLLRRAIEARYGINPPAIEQLQIEFTGRARVKIGPVKTWVPAKATTVFQFPSQFRWAYVIKPLNLPIQRSIDTFDGSRFHSSRQTSEIVEDPDTIQTMRRRLWAIAALFLTPLSEMHVTLSACGDRCFEARNKQIDDAVRVYLHEDGMLDYVEVTALNEASGAWQNLRYIVRDGQTAVNGLMLPTRLDIAWDDEIVQQIEPVSAQLNPALTSSLFTLDALSEAVG